MSNTNTPDDADVPRPSDWTRKIGRLVGDRLQDRSGIEVIPVTTSPCEPTWAMSHRFGWPDKNGVATCACGAWYPDSIAPPCKVYAPRFAVDSHRADMHWEYMNEHVLAERFGDQLADIERVRLSRDPVEADRERCQRLAGTHWTPMAGNDMPSLDNLPAEVCSGADLTFEQADVLIDRTIVLQWSKELDEWRWVKLDTSCVGLKWVEPDYQHREPELGLGGRIDGHMSALRGRMAAEVREAKEACESMGQGRSVTHYLHRAHGGIVRLGCELRELDGVTPLQSQ